MKNTFKEIENQYKKINSYTQKMKNNGSLSSGGFFNNSVEKKYTRALDSWEKYFIANKSNSNNIRFINQITFQVDGDITKAKDFYKSLQLHQKNLTEITKNISSKEVKENSYITIFNDVYNILINTKYISAFKVAYDEYKKNKSTVKGSISNIIIMCNQVLVSYLYYCMGTLNPITINTYLDVEKNKSLEKEFIDILKESQDSYWAIISDIGFSALEISKVLENVKNPSEELKKAIKTQKESSDKLAKAKESHDTAVLQNTLYEISEESYLENDISFGKEEALTVALIVIASIMGLFFLIRGIRRAIYMIGTIKTDVSEYIKVDVVTVMMNIQSLKDKLDNTTDEKERKKIQAIIDKQQKFVDRFKEKYTDVMEESSQASYESSYVIEDEDSSDEETSSSGNDYDILL